MKKAFLLLLTLLTGAATSIAQIDINLKPTKISIEPIPVGQSPYWMLTSTSALRAYAKMRVARGESQVWGNTVIQGPNSRTYVSLTGNSPHDIMWRLELEEGAISFQLANPSKDRVGRGGALLDELWQPLFSVWEFDVAPVKIDGVVWKLPQKYLELRMNDWIPIPVPIETTGGKIFYRDDNGEYRWTEWDLNAWNGWLWFQAQYAGNGQLVLQNDQGDSAVIDLPTGQQLSLATIATNVQLDTINYNLATDKGLLSGQKLETTTWMEVSDDPSWAPVFWIELSQARTVKFTATFVDVNGQTVEKPQQAYAYHKQSGELKSLTATFVLNPNGTITGPFFESNFEAPGDWIVWFKTDYFRRDPVPPYYGGGKG